MTQSHLHRRRFLRSMVGVSAGIAFAGTARTAAAQEQGMGTFAQAGAVNAQTDVQSGYLDMNGGSVFYYASGRGEPMLLLHGYPLSGALFDRNRAALASRYRLITIDQRGFGISRTSDMPNTIGTFAQNALSVMDQLSISKAIIGGHSMGGPITMEMYKRAPDRFRAMMLLNTIAAPANEIEAGLWQGFAEYVRVHGIDKMYTDALLKDMLTGQTTSSQPDLVNYLTTIVRLASPMGAIGGAQALATRPDYRSLLGQIHVPTLVYVGVEDTVYPVAISRELAGAIPNAKLVTIPGASHASVIEAPEPTNAAFLEWANGLA